MKERQREKGGVRKREGMCLADQEIKKIKKRIQIERICNQLYYENMKESF